MYIMSYGFDDGFTALISLSSGNFLFLPELDTFDVFSLLPKLQPRLAKILRQLK